MKRNRNVDILRCIAILVIIVYHAYVLSGTPWTARTTIHTLISFGGELGVTLFFVLSGFGIYLSLQHREHTNVFPTWKTFMKSRCKRIMPEYYFCIAFLLLFQSANLIGTAGLKHIAAYLTFTQNFFIDTHGSINGALWTMATILQFYLIAIWLYKAVKKNVVVSTAAAIVITVISKYVIYAYMIPAAGMEASAYFVYGRQLISALDNFVLGMAAAKIVSSEIWNKCKKQYLYGIGAVGFVMVSVLLSGVSYYLSSNGLYGAMLRGYIGHTVVAVLFAMMIICVSLLPQIQGFAAKGIQFGAKYQYGIYLWHMPLICSLLAASPAFQYMAQHNFMVFALMIIAVSVVVGWFTSKCLTSILTGSKA